MFLVLSSSIFRNAWRIPPNSLSTQALKCAKFSAPTGSNSSNEAVPLSSLSKARQRSFASRAQPSLEAARRNWTLAIDMVSLVESSCRHARIKFPCFLRSDALNSSKHLLIIAGFRPCRDRSANHCFDLILAAFFRLKRLISMPNQASPSPSRPLMRIMSSLASRRADQTSSNSLSSPPQPELIIPNMNSTLDKDSTLGFFLESASPSSTAVAKAASCCIKSSALWKRFTQY
mmetsp:Transcript_42040/g.85682  ORF Transcript_42040/g.85682 Transcript_42040/m.85682 type:complete len:232 (-) Transcript_42040:381-1076(-)